MSYKLSVYSDSAFKEYLLPAVNDADHFLHLSRAIFPRLADVELAMEVVDHCWRFLPSDNYQVVSAVTGETCFGKTLHDGDLLTVRFPGNDTLAVLVTETEQSFCVFTKYALGGVDGITIGRGEENDICYSGSKLLNRRQHAVIVRYGDIWLIQDQSSNGVFVNSIRINGKKQLAFGDCINIFGLCIVFLGDRIAVNDRLDTVWVDESRLAKKTGAGPSLPPQGATGGKIVYNRSPRQIYKLDTETVEIQEPPQPERREKRPLSLLIGPSLTMAIPMLLGCGLSIFSSRLGGAGGSFLYVGLITAISSALIGTAWAVANVRYEKKRSSEEQLHRFEAYGEYLIKCSNRIREKYERNAEHLKKMYPDAATCCGYQADTPCLWNRNASHKDFLTYRLGMGDIPFQAKIDIPKEKFTMVNDSLADKPAMIQKSFEMLHDVPVCVDLLEHSLIGIVGGREKQGAKEALYNLAVQAAVSNCYTDVKLLFIYDEKEEENGSFRFARWLPHVWSEDKKARFVAGNKNEASDVLYELTRALRTRMENSGDGKEGKIPRPYYVLIVASPQLLEGELISSYISEDSGKYGLSTVILVENYEDLPNACSYVIEKDERFEGMYAVTDNVEERVAIRFDAVSEKQLEYLARTLSNIEVREIERGGELPSSLTFFEMYGVSSLGELRAMDRWRKNRTYDSMRALVGQKAGGADCYLDVHEKYHGPHGLVAGTTGSGKSETLQTYILSLALNFSPDDVGFFLIDYKGGGMANLFAGLPHVMGQISNLSGNQVRRAMVSIKSENKRRQRIFNEHGVNNINHYTRLYKNGEASVPIPHLFIVIDEFAELKREEQEFMKELISVAQVGRSLGVHLILATQKPSGTVDDNIWSNSKFRLCLRVQDRQDSTDMLHKPDAAYITQAGRCYMQVGNDEVYELFQSGFSGATYDEEGSARMEIACMLSVTGKAALVGNHRKMRPKEASKRISRPEKRERTQLDAVVEYLRETARENGFTREQQLWLPLLPVQLFLEQLEGCRMGFDGRGWAERDKGSHIAVQIGLYDDPVNQTQRPISVDFSENGHHVVTGMAGSGKSVFLQTLLYGLVNQYTPDEVNIYAVDFSAKMLDCFRDMPHVGGIVYDGEDEKLAKFFTMAKKMIRERKKLFQGGNYSQYIRVNGAVLPAVVMAFDNFPALHSKAEEYVDAVMELVKEGVGCGIYLILTGGGFGSLEIPGRIADNIRTVFCLEMSDKFQYSEVLRRTHLEVFPETNVKGRGLAQVGEDILEYQTALAFGAADDFERMEKIRALGVCMREAWRGKMARPIPEIPQKPDWAGFAALEETQRMAADDRHLPVGYNQKDASVYGIDLSRIYCYLITGRAATGKTNFLKIVAMAAHMRRGRVVLVDFGADLGSLAGQPEAVLIDTDQKLFEFLGQLLPDFRDRNIRKREDVRKGLESEEIYEDMLAYEALFICIADLTDFVEHVTNPQEGVGRMDGFVGNILDKGSLHNVFWFACLGQERAEEAACTPIYEYFIRYRTGIRFGGEVSSERLLDFNYVDFREQEKRQKPGLGMLPENEDGAEKIVIPMWKG